MRGVLEVGECIGFQEIIIACRDTFRSLKKFRGNLRSRWRCRKKPSVGWSVTGLVSFLPVV